MKRRTAAAALFILLSALAAYAFVRFAIPNGVSAASISGLIGEITDKDALISFAVSALLPILLCALSFCVMNAAGELNLAAAGEMLLGAFAFIKAYSLLSAAVGGITAFCLSLLSGAAAGMLVGIMLALLKRLSGARGEAVGLLLSASVFFLTGYICEKADAAVTSNAFSFTDGTAETLIAVGAALLAFVLSIILMKGRAGRRWRISSLGRDASGIKGVSSASAFLSAALLSGALCGLAGAAVVLFSGKLSGETLNSFILSRWLFALSASVLASFLPSPALAFAFLLSLLGLIADKLFSPDAALWASPLIPALSLLLYLAICNPQRNGRRGGIQK